MRLVAVIPAEPALVLLMHVPHHTGRLQWAGKKAVSRQSYGVDYRRKQLKPPAPRDVALSACWHDAICRGHFQNRIVWLAIFTTDGIVPKRRTSKHSNRC